MSRKTKTTNEDYVKELQAMKEAYLSLERINPNHELLNLAKLNKNGSEFTFTPVYLKYFVDEDKDRFARQGYIRYTNALNSELNSH